MFTNDGLVEQLITGYAEPQRGWRRIMCLTAYVDDSGSEPESPVYVLGGLVLPADWWRTLSNEWSGVLGASPSIEYFKASEVGDRVKGPFRNFTGPERTRKVNALVDVLCSAHPLALSISLEWKVFEGFRSKYNLLPIGRDPYFFLYYSMIALSAQCAARESNPSPIDFVFDNQGDVGNSVVQWYQFFKDRMPSWLILGKTPEFGDEKLCPPLQAADLFAWYGRRNALNAFNPEWQWQQNVGQLLNRYHSRSEISLEGLIAIAKDFCIIEA
jgi:hypothetical protein